MKKKDDVSKIKDFNPEKTRLRATISFSIEYDIKKNNYPESCKTLEGYIAIDIKAIWDDYQYFLDQGKMKVTVIRVRG